MFAMLFCQNEGWKLQENNSFRLIFLAIQYQGGKNSVAWEQLDIND